MSQLGEQAATKEFLRAIVDNDYTIPDDVDPFALANALLRNFASPDGELRDELSYMILASGIIGKQKLTHEQLEKILSSMLDDDHLFYSIGEIETESVFIRSFSNLVIAAILYNDGQHPGLSSDLLRRTKTALLRYAREERDWRGYVVGSGWAHAMAHLADALDECAQNHAMDMQDRKEILMTLRELARLPEPLYNEEDVRLAMVAYHLILTKRVDDGFFQQWIKSCFVQRDSDVVSWTQSTNSKNFLRSLYFLLHWDGVAPVLAEQISAILKRQDEL